MNRPTSLGIAITGMPTQKVISWRWPSRLPGVYRRTTSSVSLMIDRWDFTAQYRSVKRAFRLSFLNGFPAMTIEQMRATYQAQPFQPFVIHLADGRQLPVEHPEFIMTAPSGRTVVVAQPDDAFHIIDLLLVTDLEIKPATNGSRRKRKT